MPHESGAPKNIVLCSDGTGNMGGKAEGTNVWRLFLAVDQAQPPAGGGRRQIAFHDDGVGTTSFKLLRLLGGAFGWGISRNLERLYGFLVQNYTPGDDVYLFGFSRGAFTVRVLADLIAVCGIARRAPDGKTELSPSEIARLSRRALAAYKLHNRRLFPTHAAQRFRDEFSHPDDPNKPFPVKFLGAWDTVDAVGLPFDELTAAFSWLFPLRFRDHHLSGSVRRACHALSLDETRLSFQPVLWEPIPKEGQKVEQVWFPGVHANVGGGYPKDQLALVALDWMMSRADEEGLRFDRGLWAAYNREANVQGQLYDSRAGLGSYYRFSPRRLDTVGDPTPLTPGLARTQGTGRGRRAGRPPETGPEEQAHGPVPVLHVSVLQRIAGGIDGYAPTGVPEGYDVDASPSRCPGTAPPESAPPESGHEGPRRRVEYMQGAYDLIWWRKVAYLLLLVATFWVLYCGWVLSVEPVNPPPVPVVTSALDVARAMAPWKLADVVAGYQKYPWLLLASAAVYGVLMWWSAHLRSRTRDVAVAAWRRGFGHQVSKPAGWRRCLYALSGLARPVRNSAPLGAAFRFARANLVPPLTLALVAAVLFGRVGWYWYHLPEPQESGSTIELLPGKSRRLEFDTRNPYQATGVMLVRGERYAVAADAKKPKEAWVDNHTLPASPAGLEPGWQTRPLLWLFVPARRAVEAPWYELRGEIGTTGHYPVAIGSGNEFVANESGELFLFVNDVPGFYKNNEGTADVTITRLSGVRAAVARP